MAIDPEFLVVGHLTKAHGVQGAFFVTPLTDHPETNFSPGVRLLLGNDDARVDRRSPEMTIITANAHKNGLLVVFEEVADRTEAERLRGRYLLRPIEELDPLAEDEVFHHQLLEATVVTTEGEELGTVIEVHDLQPFPMLELRGRYHGTLIPYNREIVVEVEQGRIVVDPPEGLLDL